MSVKTDFKPRFSGRPGQSFFQEYAKMKTAIQIAVVLLSTLPMWSAQAQGVDLIRRSYQETPPLPIAPALGGMNGMGMHGGMGVGQAMWDATVADKSIRKVIEKWSSASGWTFGLEQWGIDRDLPILAKASFPGDFRGAIRGLLATTELTDAPLQPCFYSNFVLRVVPRSEVCDRMAPVDR